MSHVYTKPRSRLLGFLKAMITRCNLYQRFFSIRAGSLCESQSKESTSFNRDVDDLI